MNAARLVDSMHKLQDRPCAHDQTRAGPTRCSPTNQLCSSCVRTSWLTIKSLVPSSPASLAWRAMGRASVSTISWASRRRSNC
jgi:hypothetical protein